MPNIVGDVVELLTAARNGAPAEQVHRAVERLGTGVEAVTGEAPQLAELAAAVDRLRGEHQNFLRRETELHRLLQAAQRLLGVDAVDELLTVIVQATRDLIGSHVAHINLQDRDGLFATIRATAGARTDEFRKQRTPAGAGMTGLVMSRRSPYVTQDYLTDPAITHDPSGDGATRADNLVTIAGAPMLDGDEQVGVLMASWRRPTVVTDEQVDLLMSLASLAAVAVVSARRHEEIRQSRIALQEANDRFAAVNTQLEWGAEAHDRLLGFLRPGAKIAVVPEAMSELLQAPAAVLDAHGELLASFPQDWQPSVTPADLEQATSTDRAFAVAGERPTTLWAAPAQSGGELLAVLVTERDSLHEMGQRTLERAATATALLLATENALTEAQLRTSADLVGDLVRGRDFADTNRLAASLGFDLRAPKVVLVAIASSDRRHLGRSTFRSHAERCGGVSGEVDGHLVAILPQVDPEAAAVDAAAALDAAGVPVAVGASGPVDELTDVTAHFATALDCARAQDRLTGSGPATVKTLGFVGLLLAGPDRANFGGFVSRSLGPIEDSDTNRHTNLVDTLEAYLERNRSVRDTARHLHIHTNTVMQRLQRVETLLEIDLSTTETAAELLLALRLRRLMAGADERTTAKRAAPAKR